MRVVLVSLFSVLVGVKCAPGLSVGKLNVPVGNKNSQSVDVGLTDDGVKLNHHQERNYEKNDRSEQHDSSIRETNYQNGSSYHGSRVQSERDNVHDAHETHKESEDKGISIGKGGLNAYDNKKQSDDKTVKDQESGRDSTMHKDRTANSGHYDDSGSNYNKTSETNDHKDSYENKGFSLGGGGAGSVHERGSSESHDETKHEDGSSWGQTKDFSKDGNRMKGSSSKQNSNYSKDTKESSAKNNQEKETRAYDQGGQNTDLANQSSQGNGAKEYGHSIIMRHLYKDGYFKNNEHALNMRQTGFQNSGVSQEYLQSLKDKINAGVWQNQAGNIAQIGNAALIINVAQVGNAVQGLGAAHAGNASSQTQSSANPIGSHYSNLQAINSIYEKLNQQIGSQHPLYSSNLPVISRPDYTSNSNLGQHDNSQIVQNAQNRAYVGHSLRTYDKSDLTKSDHYLNQYDITTLQNLQYENQHENAGRNTDSYTRIDDIRNESERQYGQNKDSSYAPGNVHDKNRGYNDNEHEVIKNIGSKDTEALTRKLLATLQNDEDVVKELEEGKFSELSHRTIIIVPSAQANDNSDDNKYEGNKNVYEYLMKNGFTKDQQINNTKINRSKGKDRENNYENTRTDKTIKSNIDSEYDRSRSYDGSDTRSDSYAVITDRKQKYKSSDVDSNSRSEKMDSDESYSSKRYNGDYNDDSANKDTKLTKKVSRFDSDADRVYKKRRVTTDYKDKHLTEESVTDDTNYDSYEYYDEDIKLTKGGKKVVSYLTEDGNSDYDDFSNEDESSENGDNQQKNKESNTKIEHNANESSQDESADDSVSDDESEQSEQNVTNKDTSYNSGEKKETETDSLIEKSTNKKISTDQILKSKENKQNQEEESVLEVTDKDSDDDES